jgi:hypothetical protein
MSTIVDVTPDTAVLVALAESDLGWKKALGELIDNAIDHGAQNVWVSFLPSRRGAIDLQVVDDGEGCADLESFIKLGAHRKSSTTVLGRFGVGAKDATLWAGGVESVFRVKSVYRARARTLSADWSDMIRQNKWQLIQSDPEEAAGLTGTTIRVEPICRRVPDGKGWTSLLNELGYLYSPAIKNGVRIWLKAKLRSAEKTQLEPYKLPLLEPDHIDQSLTVNGNRIRVYAGIVRSGVPNPRPGISYFHGFRVIIQNSGKGCGDISPARIAGFVELKDGWVLTKNKDNVSRSADALFEAVYQCIKPVLERAKKASHVLDSEALRRSIEDKVNAAFGTSNAKAVRDPGDNPGTRKPTGRGGRHKQAEKDQDGATFARKRYGRLKIDFQDLGEDQDMSSYSTGTVIMNTSHPRILGLRDRKNDDALAIIAVYEFAHAYAHTSEEEILGKRMRLALNSEDSNDKFHKTVTGMLSRGLAIDGQELKAAGE